ncbi:PH domain-containing protein [Mycolicibacterium bacteremicum]|uniref:Low molecular weight protein antigen 6 PH domain-containing protein n=1 Tax=Mycolicibacterium bacteremicum TaxID=564198 RepID=A0A1W9YQY4_MYCBA|nr:PH domain-containing protein [Mycolicibacterium bacteremicum]MCV7432815.1 PH domain-containing protein [Mycolicibacterium bacteremicum]ORA02434.1 hypothetical protein BST17_23820 [Mycolicibacterium bacteremicum]
MQQTSWAPKSAAVIVTGIAGLVLAVAAVTVVTDLPGRVMGAVAGAGLLVFALGSWRARPKLAITEAGLAVRGWVSSRVITGEEIALIRVTEFSRLARKQRLLEIDTTDDRLYVFTRWDLGTSPVAVLDALTDAGYAR